MKLAERHCQPKAGALDAASIAALLHEVPQWRVVDGALARTFKLADYRATIAFVNAVAAVVDEQDHHPEMTVGYNTCRIAFITHSAGNTLTDNDFICAAKIDALEAQA